MSLAVEILASTSLLKPVDLSANKTSDDLLSRSKRFLVYTPNGGTLKWVSGYLGPIDIPKWQNINCLRNVQFQYDLPPRWVTNPPSFPGLNRRSQGRSLDGSPVEEIKPDKSRKIAYDVVERVLNK